MGCPPHALAVRLQRRTPLPAAPRPARSLGWGAVRARTGEEPARPPAPTPRALAWSASTSITAAPAPGPAGGPGRGVLGRRLSRASLSLQRRRRRPRTKELDGRLVWRAAASPPQLRPARACMAKRRSAPRPRGACPPPRAFGARGDKRTRCGAAHTRTQTAYKCTHTCSCGPAGCMCGRPKEEMHARRRDCARHQYKGGTGKGGRRVQDKGAAKTEGQQPGRGRQL